MIQNGPTPFIHPVTQVRIGPYEFYEGNAHQKHENIVEEDASQHESDKLPEGDQTPKGENGEKAPEGNQTPQEGEILPPEGDLSPKDDEKPKGKKKLQKEEE